MNYFFLALITFVGLIFPMQPIVADENGWVEGRIREMTLREKIGQMMMVGIYGDRITASEAKYLVDNAIGNIILFDQNITDEDQLAGMTSYLQEAVTVSSGIPLIIAVDQEGGVVNRIGKISGLKYTRHNANVLGKTFQYAPKKAKAALFNANLALGKRMQELGINMNLAPVLDLAPEESSYIHSRSYGSSPTIVTAAARSVVDGLKATNIISTGKHFPNLGYSTEDSHHILPVINRQISELKNYEFLPFIKLKDEIDAIMIGHVLVPELDKIYPASISKNAINVLRNDIGFSGLIISDDLKMKALTQRYTVPEIGIRSVIAGNDVLLAAWDKEKQLQMMLAIEKAVRRNVISEDQINQSVARILTLKYKYLIDGKE
jgi:beta-N-acetylhexosaminidase